MILDTGTFNKEADFMSSPSSVKDIGSRLELFVDDYLIDRLSNAQLK